MDQDKGKETVEANRAMNKLFRKEQQEGVVDPQTAGTAASEEQPTEPSNPPPPD